MTPYEILTAAQELIRDPAKWCREVPARDASGNCRAATDNDACAWCDWGAIVKASPKECLRNSIAAEKFFWEAAKEIDPTLKEDRGYIGYFNDLHDHATQMRAFDLAREKAKAANV